MLAWENLIILALFPTHRRSSAPITGNGQKPSLIIFGKRPVRELIASPMKQPLSAQGICFANDRSLITDFRCRAVFLHIKIGTGSACERWNREFRPSWLATAQEFSCGELANLEPVGRWVRLESILWKWKSVWTCFSTRFSLVQYNRKRAQAY